MKETGFIKQNIDKWQEYENELGKPKKDPATISRLYVQVTDDLSYAQTYYKNRSVRVYLNGIAQLLFNDINQTDKFKFQSFIDFWKVDLPVTLYKVRYELLFSFLIFMLMAGVGVITSVHEPNFARTILGDKYVDMTIDNINKHDPMAVYKDQNGLDMFLGITVNNIKIAFYTFALGLLFGLGTLLSLMKNGIMLGTFQYFFIERDLFRKSFLTIWQHGTLEISAIIIAGAAGFAIGRGLILPGTYTRFQSLRITAKRGIKVMIGLIPVFIFAAFIEGFFTRYTDAPDGIRLLTILFSLSFVLIYFVFYPRRVAKKYPEKLEIADKIGAPDNSLPSLKKILNSDMLFGGTLKIVVRNFGRIMRFILIGSLILAALAATFHKEILNVGTEGLINQQHAYRLLVSFKTNTLLFVLNSIIIGLALFIATVPFLKMKTDSLARGGTGSLIKFNFIINALIASTLFSTLFFLPAGWGLFLSLLVLPVLLLIYYVSIINNKNYFEAIGPAFELFRNGFGEYLLHNFKFLVISLLILILSGPHIYNRVLLFIKWNLWLEDIYVQMILNFIITFVFYFTVLFNIILLAIANNLVFHSLNEIRTGEELLNEIEQIGNRNTIRGYEFE